MLIYSIYNTVNAYWVGESAFPLFDCIVTLITSLPPLALHISLLVTRTAPCWLC